MGALTALPALDVATPQQPNLLDQFSKLQALRGTQQDQQQRAAEAPARQQILSQQAQSGQLQLQQDQQTAQDQQSFRAYAQDPANKGKTIGDLADGLLQNGKISQNGWIAAKKADVENRQGLATLTKDQLANADTAHKQTQQLYDNVMDMPDDQLAANWTQIAQQYDAIPGNNKQPLDPNKPLTKQQLQTFGPVISMQRTYLDEAIARAQKQADTHKANAQGDEADALAGASLLKQYAPTLAQSANPQDYAKKLQAFETLHPAMAGRFPQQFDPKNPQAVLNAGMSASEVADYQQKDRLDKYNQGQENYRAQLGRATTFQNTQMLHGLNQIDQYTADPQHGYGQFVSQAGAVKSAIQQAKNGNELAASLEPMMVALGVSSFAGVHRINATEINQAGPAVGSVFRKLNNLVSTVGTGKPTDAQLNEANDIIDNLTAARHSAYIQGVSAVAANTGLDPKKVTVFDRGGNLATLDTLRGKGASAAASQAGTVPHGATMKVPGSDGQLHWSDGKNDLGVVR